VWEAPAQKLLTNDTGQVIGVQVKSKDGKTMSVKASKAVILTTGGFEYDAKAQRSYFSAFPMVYYGNPDNTGDGMRMAQELGADLWHMPVLGGGLKAKFADFPTAFSIGMNKPNYVILDKTGKRYFNEPKIGGYAGYWNQIVYDTIADTWPRIPSYWIFDETVRTAGTLATTVFGAAGAVKMYEWSKDNSKEIEKGWVVKADTIEELAGKLKMDPAALKAEIDKYNASVKAGKDEAFGRDPKLMAAIETAPFYAITAWPGMNNTFGGPRRNAKAQIVDVNGNSIPRLYSAGELGSVYVQYPQGGANIGECIAFGRIAAESAVAETAQV
jgi:3-oxosteroid 1-dehydrogenase